MKTKHLSQKEKVNISLLFISVILIASNPIFSQDVGDRVRLKIKIPVITVEPLVVGEKVGKSYTAIGGFTKFIVISKTNTEVKVQALDYSKLQPSYIAALKKDNKNVPDDLSEYYNDKIYTVSKSDFDLSAVLDNNNKRISIGLLTLPFKARPQDDFTFDTEFNLNTTLNIAIKHWGDDALNLQLGAGLGSVGLTSNNSSGVADDKAQDVTTLTFLSGIMYSHKNIQIGLYGGFDQINNQKNFRWESNGNLWFAFGIGYDIFEIATAGKANKQ